jgi:hypothetical protein
VAVWVATHFDAVLRWQEEAMVNVYALTKGCLLLRHTGAVPLRLAAIVPLPVLGTGGDVNPDAGYLYPMYHQRSFCVCLDRIMCRIRCRRLSE